MTTRGTKTPGTPVRSGASHIKEDDVAIERRLYGQASEKATAVV